MTNYTYMCILSDPTIKRTYLLRLNAMICQILAFQLASVIESGKWGQLLWHESLKQVIDDPL